MSSVDETHAVDEDNESTNERLTEEAKAQKKKKKKPKKKTSETVATVAEKHGPEKISVQQPTTNEIADALKDALHTKIAMIEQGKHKTTDFDPKTVDASTEVAAASSLLTANEGKTTQEQLDILRALYISQVKSQAVAVAEIRYWQNRYIISNSHYSTLADQHARVSALKNKLEELCKELQKRNVFFQEENKLIRMEQQKQHQGLTKKFEDSIQHISEEIEKNKEDRDKVALENTTLRGQIGKVLEYDKAREAHTEHQLKTKDMEHQLLTVKMKQYTEVAQASLEKATAYETEVHRLTANESHLKNQLTDYSKKFESLQETMSKSNTLFSTFKGEMEKMSKLVKKKDTEINDLHTKLKESHVSLINLHDQKKEDILAINKLTRQKEQLTNLCKSLTAKKVDDDRDSTTRKIDENNTAQSSKDEIKAQQMI